MLFRSSCPAAPGAQMGCALFYAPLRGRPAAVRPLCAAHRAAVAAGARAPARPCAVRPLRGGLAPLARARGYRTYPWPWRRRIRPPLRSAAWPRSGAGGMGRERAPRPKFLPPPPEGPRTRSRAKDKERYLRALATPLTGILGQNSAI